jgi:hypothetical protein
LSDTGTTEPRYFFTSSGCSWIASEIEQKITPAFFSSSWKVVPTETLSNTASTATLRPSAGVLGALDAREDHLFLQRDAQLFIGRQQLGIDLVQRLRLLLHALGAGVVILVLEVDLGIIDHRPVGLFHLSQRS